MFSLHAFDITCFLPMHLISHALHPLDNILVSMSTFWSMHGLTSHGVQCSSSPIEAASIAEGEQNSVLKINHVKEQRHAANIDQKVNYIPVMKAVRINPATPQKDATNLKETLRQGTGSTLGSKP